MRFLAVFALLLVQGAALAQHEVYAWRSFTQADGLPSDGVIDVHEASDGTVWVACRDGVAVYDGRAWQCYGKVFAEDGSEIHLDHATCVEESAAEDPQPRRIWIGTDGSGVVVHDPAAGTWRVIDHASTEGGLASDQIHDILIASDNTVWFGLEGAVCHLDRRGSWTTFDEENGLPIDGFEVYTLHEDSRRGWIWIAGYHLGLHCWRGDRWIHYSEKGITDSSGARLSSEGLPNKYVYSVTHDEHGDLWLAMVGGGVACLTAESDFLRFRPVDIELASYKVTGVIVGPDRDLWFSTFEGITRWNPKTGRSEHFRAGPYFSSGFFRRVRYGPKNKALWFTSLGGGLVGYLPTGFRYYGEEEMPQSDRDLRGGLAVAPDGAVWGAMRRGVFRLDHHSRGNLFEHYTCAELGFEDRPDTQAALQCIYTEANGWIWVGGNMGLSVKRGASWQRVPIQIEGRAVEAYVWAIFRDREGRLWVTTEKQGVFCQPSSEDSTWHQISRASSPLPGDTVYTVFQDIEGDIWFGTNKGVMRMRYARGAEAPPDWEVYTVEEGLSMDRVYSIQQSADGKMWFGGLYAIDSWDGQEFRRIDSETSQGQIGNGIYCFRMIKTRRSGRESLWFAVQGMGLVRYSEPRRWKLWTTYRAPDGLIGNAAGVAEDEEGVLWIATGRGLVSYTPEKDPPSVWPSESNLPILPSDGAGKFSAQGRDAFHRTPPQELRFRARLDEEPWSDFQREALFFVHGLSPGPHTIYFQAIDRDLNFSNIANYSFRVQRPWWQTPWVWGLASGIVIAVLIAWLVVRALNEKRRQALVNAESVSAAVTQFVRGGNGPAQGAIGLQLDGAGSDTALGRLEAASQVLQRGLRLVPSTRLSKIAEELLHEYRERTAAGIHFHLMVVRNEPTANLDPDKISLALDHLLRNAVDALLGREDATIRVTIQRGSGFLRKSALILRVEDDGPGIPEEVCRRLRTPFNAHDKKGHMGLGLFHVHQIATLHRGKLLVSPRPGGGTTAEIHLPTNLA